MANVIRLNYVEHGKTYHGEIDKEVFLDQMQHMVEWFPDCNCNAKKLCELIPHMDCITINQDIIDSQDVPFLMYYAFGQEYWLRLRRTYTIIWGFFMYHCQKAKNNNN